RRHTQRLLARRHCRDADLRHDRRRTRPCGRRPGDPRGRVDDVRGPARQKRAAGRAPDLPSIKRGALTMATITEPPIETTDAPGGIGWDGQTLHQMLDASEALFADTGHYHGLRSL